MKQLSNTAQKIKNMEIRGAGRIARAAAAELRDYSERLGKGKLVEFNTKMSEGCPTSYQYAPHSSITSKCGSCCDEI